MRIRNCHERVIAATSAQLAELVCDFEAIWPLPRAPQPLGDRRLDASPMIWEDIDRSGAIRAFRVVAPEALERVEHWFETERRESGTLLRHTVEGDVSAEGDALWRERIEPVHDGVMEALFDKIEEVVGRRR